MAEQVHGDHVEALGRDRPRERLVHPAWHQLSVHQHDPPVPTADSIRPPPLNSSPMRSETKVAMCPAVSDGPLASGE